ncbi:MAG TPA: sigma-70 family RNA polymerase sigma factor [Bryobacteraceae bacterium]|nr:sigma-70 family RNA polymerase sigma factor [Bryobacteraceae bacterium]
MILPLLMAVLTGAEDGGLLERLKRRDPHALAELYDRYGRLVFSLVVRIVRDKGIAEDLVQETFLRVWNRVHSVDSEKGSLGPWLLAIGRNRALDYLRSSAGRDRASAVELDETGHAALFGEIEPGILMSDQLRRVKQALEKMAPNYRTVMELAYFEGLSQSEMSAKMGQPLGTIKTWVRTALQSLRDELGVVAS